MRWFYRPTRRDLETQITNLRRDIMTAVSDFVAQQTAFNADIASDLTSIQASITALNNQITALQNSPGALSPADQAALNQLEVSGAALQAQADTTAGKTPPVIPPIVVKST
jgi:hypothetical protein